MDNRLFLNLSTILRQQVVLKFVKRTMGNLELNCGAQFDGNFVNLSECFWM